MAPPQPGKKKQSLSGTKYLMVSACLALVLGLWNLFSNKANAGQNAQDVNPASETVPDSILDLPPLPTLAGAVNLSQTGTQPLAVSAQDNAQPSTLRQVGLPTPVPTVSKPAVIQAVVISVPSGGGSKDGGGNKSSGSKSTSTRTSSSRR